MTLRGCRRRTNSVSFVLTTILIFDTSICRYLRFAQSTEFISGACRIFIFFPQKNCQRKTTPSVCAVCVRACVGWVKRRRYPCLSRWEMGFYFSTLSRSLKLVFILIFHFYSSAMVTFALGLRVRFAFLAFSMTQRHRCRHHPPNTDYCFCEIYCCGDAHTVFEIFFAIFVAGIDLVRLLWLYSSVRFESGEGNLFRTQNYLFIDMRR